MELTGLRQVKLHVSGSHANKRLCRFWRQVVEPARGADVGRVLVAQLVKAREPSHVAVLGIKAKLVHQHGKHAHSPDCTCVSEGAVVVVGEGVPVGDKRDGPAQESGIVSGLGQVVEDGEPRVISPVDAVGVVIVQGLEGVEVTVQCRLVHGALQAFVGWDGLVCTFFKKAAYQLPKTELGKRGEEEHRGEAKGRREEEKRR